MEKIGQIFRRTRETQRISLKKAALELGIQEKFLLAIESDCYSDLPSGLYPELYIGKYARFLGLTEGK
ncbi:MAG: helix-turn-helix domain-containing protein, partial [Patescibacteria group bacterium]